MRVTSVLGGLALPLLAIPATGQEATQSASARAMLEEVVVTARRREESLQDLPLSVQAVTADAMQAQGVYNIQAIDDFVPNLVLNEDARANDTRMFIRGVGGGFSNPDQVFGVGMYIDGHYLSGSLGAFMSTVDVERVEVLRGPQGTLFGKNTTGGAVSLVSAKPGPEFDSYLTLRAGEFGQQDVRGMVNVPITDSLYFRGNLASEQTDGHYVNRFNGEDTNGTDQRSLGLALRWLPGDAWTVDFRLGMSEDRDDNLAAQCRAYPDEDMYYALLNNPANDRDADPSTWTALPFAGPDLVLGTADDIVYQGPGPFEEGEGAWGSSNIGNLRIDALYPGANAHYLNTCHEIFSSGDVWQTYQDFNTRSHVDNDMFNINARWDMPGELGPFENASLQVQGAWRYSSYRYQQDRDFGPGHIDHVGNLPNKSGRGIARWTDEIELIFNGDLTERINLTAGLYWFDDLAETGNGTCINQWLDAYDPNAGPIDPNTGRPEGTINGLPDDDIECIPEGGTFFHRLPDTSFTGQSSNWGAAYTESKAIYAHMVYSITDQWDLALGARYMEDYRRQQAIEIGAVPGSCTLAENGPLELCAARFIMNRDTVINNGFFVNEDATFDEVTPTISLTRHLSPGNLLDSGIVYGTISEGYLTGAFNSELNPNAPAFTAEQQANIRSIIPYGPEHVTNYELGFKGTFAGGNLRLSSAIFLMDYKDKQEAIDIDNSDGRFGPDPALEFIQNAADAELTGLEVELRASPWAGGFISLDVGFLESEYSNFLVVDLDNPDQLIDISNRRLPNQTPEWTVTLSVEHAFRLANGATLTPQIGVYAQDEMEWLPGLDRDEKSAICHQDSYSKWRTRLTYEPADASWTAALYGYNVTDEEILYRCQGIRSGSFGAWYEPPSQWGAEFTMRFGEG